MGKESYDVLKSPKGSRPIDAHRFHSPYALPPRSRQFIDRGELVQRGGSVARLSKTRAGHAVNDDNTRLYPASSTNAPTGVKDTFDVKLTRLLQDKAFHPYISGNEDGSEITIHDQPGFITNALPRLCQSDRFESFQKQLLNYGYYHANDGPRTRSSPLKYKLRPGVPEIQTGDHMSTPSSPVPNFPEHTMLQLMWQVCTTLPETRSVLERHPLFQQALKEHQATSESVIQQPEPAIRGDISDHVNAHAPSNATQHNVGMSNVPPFPSMQEPSYQVDSPLPERRLAPAPGPPGAYEKAARESNTTGSGSQLTEWSAGCQRIPHAPMPNAFSDHPTLSGIGQQNADPLAQQHLTFDVSIAQVGGGSHRHGYNSYSDQALPHYSTQQSPTPLISTLRRDDPQGLQNYSSFIPQNQHAQTWFTEQSNEVASGLDGEQIIPGSWSPDHAMTHASSSQNTSTINLAEPNHPITQAGQFSYVYTPPHGPPDEPGPSSSERMTYLYNQPDAAASPRNSGGRYEPPPAASPPCSSSFSFNDRTAGQELSTLVGSGNRVASCNSRNHAAWEMEVGASTEQSFSPHGSQIYATPSTTSCIDTSHLPPNYGPLQF